MIKHLSNQKFKRYKTDWIVGIAFVIYFFLIAERAKPFYRQFSLNDLTISHPFSTVERVSGLKCILIASLVPLLVITLTTIYRTKSIYLSFNQFNLLQVSILGLLLSMSINGVITDILKNWVARPRPDFLERCGPEENTPLNRLVDISVCTAPLGQSLLVDGMRSTPSGHSSISFSGLAYLTLWLYGQFKVMHRNQLIYKTLVCSLPLLLACYIALSRVQDYRHHFFDIFFGTLLGCFFAIFIYHRFFNYIWHANCDKVIDEDGDDSVLPVYNN